MNRVLLCIALLAATLARAGEQELALYPGAVHTRIGKDLVILGGYYRMAYFQTEDPPQKVAEFFAKQWESQGYPVMIDGNGETDLVVSAFYTREGLQRSVVIRVYEGKTVGFTVLKDLWQSEPTSRPPGEISLQGSMFSTSVRERDGRAEQANHVVDRELSLVYADVAQQLEAKGFTRTREEKRGEKGKRQWQIEHRKGFEEVVTLLVELDDGTTGVQQLISGDLGDVSGADPKAAPKGASK